MIKRALQEEFIQVKRELLELKTAQTKPSIMRLFDYSFQVSSVAARTGARTYRIQFEPDQNAEPPMVWSYNFTGPTGSGLHLAPFNATEQTQDIRVDRAGTITVLLVSTRRINSVTYIGKDADPVYPSAEEWVQVRAFYPQDMGTTPGWCLQNTRLGFHIYSGTYQSARADMEAQQANGTLHGGTPPDYIACPIYFANYDYTVYGHVAAWDHGRIYSDGVEYPSIASVANNYTGWGEFCDGTRVVQHV